MEASVRSDSVIAGKIGDVKLEMMLDSGSLLCQDNLVEMRATVKADILTCP